MAGVEISFEGVAEVAERFGDPNVIERPLTDLVRNAGLIAERAAREGMPKDTSEGARSIVSQVHGLEAKVTSPLVHVAVMDQGRAPGSRMPPPESLLGWMRRKGIPEEMAFPLARAIGRRGIKGRFFYAKAVKAVEADVPRLVSKFVADVKARLEPNG
jgi:hypothetical protein